MAGPWDVVEDAPLEAPVPSVARTVPFQPSVGERNALMPGGVKIIARGTPRTSMAQPPETFRAPTDQDKQVYGPLVDQISSRGRVTYKPKEALAATNGIVPGKLTPQDMVYLNKLRTQADETHNMAGLMDEFVALNKDTDTGGIMAQPGVNAVLSPFDNKRSRMGKIVDQITPGMRNGLPGAASDRDVAMFRNAAVNMDTPYLANKATATAAKAFAVRQNDYVTFLEAYAKKNGNLLGARERWAEYADANPVFEEKPDDNGMLVARKPTPWRTVMADLKPDSPAKTQQVAPAQQQQPGGKPRVRKFNLQTGGFDE